MNFKYLLYIIIFTSTAEGFAQNSLNLEFVRYSDGAVATGFHPYDAALRCKAPASRQPTIRELLEDAIQRGTKIEVISKTDFKNNNYG